jgi:hypothetical protein
MSKARAESSIVEKLSNATTDNGLTVDLSEFNLSDLPFDEFERLNKRLTELGTTRLSLAATKLIQKTTDMTCSLIMILYQTKVETLDLSDDSLYRLYRDPQLGTAGICRITTNLKCSSVKTLILRSNYLFWPGLLDSHVFVNPEKDSNIIKCGVDGVNSLAQGLKRSCANLRTLDLSDNMTLVNIIGGVAIKGIQALVSVPKSLVGTNICTLVLNKNYIGRMNNVTLTQFTQGFEKTAITTLILHDNELASLEQINGAESLAQFSSGFRSSSVSKLDLQNNNLFNLSETAVRAFSSGFRGTPVTELDIRQNQFLGLKGDTLARWVHTFASGIKGSNVHTVCHGLNTLAFFDEPLQAALDELNIVLAENKAAPHHSTKLSANLGL